MKQIKPIPLQEQIGRLNDGRYALPDIPDCIVRQMARCPLNSYLAGFPLKAIHLRHILGLLEDRDDGTTYQEAAGHIARLWDEGRRLSAEKAVTILTAPLCTSFYERRGAHAGNTKHLS